jgi:exopolyphosphatase/guanosine-5'-triphosphate,3'-diphosphate pyrophosphatase
VRVAAIDLGTNSTRLLVAEVNDGSVDEVFRRETITRLGEGVDSRRRLLPVPIARVRNCLVDYRRELEQAGARRALVVGTSAVRDAENGEAFLGEIEWSYGFTTRLLSGDEEAELTLRGVATGRPLDDDTLVLDVGGGSTELSRPGYRVSVDIGSTRLTERFVRSDPPTPNELEEAAGAVRSLLAERLPDNLRPRRLVGVAGTITTLAMLADREVLSAEDVWNQLVRLASVPIAERRAFLPEPDRAPMIVGGVLIVLEVMRFFDLGALEVSGRDILEGTALEAAQLPEPVEGDAPPGAYTCC